MAPPRSRSAMRPKAEAAALRARLRQLGDPGRATGAKAYMRSELPFTGTTMPDVRRTARAWLKAHPDVTRADLRAVVDAFWEPAVFEVRLLATVLLQQRPDLLGPRDLPWLERLLRSCRAWAPLDNLAPYAVADVLAMDPATRRRTLLRWAKDDDFWMRRTALLTMHRQLAKGAGDWALWTQVAASQLEDQPRWRKAKPTAEERFFIRKAIGWALRDRAKSHPGDVVAFLLANGQRMAGLSLREASRGLPAQHRLSVAAKARGPAKAGDLAKTRGPAAPATREA